MGLNTFKSFHKFKNWRMAVIKHVRKRAAPLLGALRLRDFHIYI